MDRRYFGFAILFICIFAFVSGCDTDRYINGKQASPSKSLAERAKVRSRAVGIWSNPIRLGSSTLANGTNAYFHGPFFDLSGTNEAYVGWRVHDMLDSTTGQFAFGNTTVLHTSSIGGAWEPHSPIPVAKQSISSIPHFLFSDIATFAPASWTAVALWGESRNIYVSEWVNGVAWSPPTMLGNGQNGWLVSDAGATASAIWIQDPPPGVRNFSINMARLQTVGGWNRQMGRLVRDGEFIMAAQPKADGAGNILFVWAERSATGLTSIYSTRYNAAGFFENPRAVRVEQIPGLTNYLSLFLAVDKTIGDAELVYQTSDSGTGNGLFAVHYLNGIGWQSERNVDRNVNSADRTRTEIAGFDSNDNGEITLAWVEDQTDGVYTYTGVYGTRYTSFTGWEVPQPVSAPAVVGPVGSIPGANPGSTVMHNIHVSMRDSISAVSWVENSSNLSELFVATYSQARGFGVPELVTSVLPQNGYVESPQTQISAVGIPFVVWRQTTVGPQGRAVDVMISGQGTQGGTVITPGVFDPNLPKPVTHIPSTNNCLACHSVTGVTLVNHSEVIGDCVSCHNGLVAPGKSLNHLQTTDVCAACHTTQFWIPIVSVDHTQVLGSCTQCHNNVLARGKTPNHMPTSDVCEACHTITVWAPVFRVDHRQVSGPCIGCHNNVVARGKSATHIPSPDQCELCHTTRRWRAVTNPGTGLITRGTPKPVNHIPSSDACEACHINGSPIVTVVDHNQVIGSCESCHNGNLAAGKSLTHILTTDRCAACHVTTVWRPAMRVDHAEVIGACFSCHNNITSIGKPPNHIPAPDNCEACHSTIAWSPAINVLPPGSVTPSVNWSSAAMIWSDNVAGSSMIYVHGPELSSSLVGDIAVSFVKHSQFNGLTGKFERGEPGLYTLSGAQAGWLPEQPAGQNVLADSSMMQVKYVEGAGALYALWSKNGSLYLAAKLTGSNWQAPQLLGKVDGYYQLVKTPNQPAVAVIWRERGVADMATLNARLILVGNQNPTTSNIPVPVTASFSEPVVDANGAIHLANVQMDANSQPGLPPSIRVNYLRYDANVGFSMVSPGPTVPFITTAPVIPQLTLVQNSPMLILSVLGANSQFGGGIYWSVMQSNFGWSALQRVDDNQTTQDFVVAMPALVNNGNGQLMLAWAEGVTRPGTAFDYHVYASQWNGTRWSTQVALGSGADHGEGDPALAVTSTGTVFATWTASLMDRSVLYVRRYNPLSASPLTAWEPADMVTATDATTRGLLQSPTITSVGLNNVILAWKEYRRSDFGIENIIWASQKLSP